MSPGDTLRVGLVGSGISQSLTPAMHMREGAEAGLGYDYVLLDIDHSPAGGPELAGIVAEAERAGFRGLNITHPFKQAILPLLDEADEDVSVIGACNTVVFEDGRRIGHNTDWWGFAESFKRAFLAADLDHVVQLGAGGAGAAVAYALLTLGVRRLEVIDVDPARARGLADRYNPTFGAGRLTPGGDLGAALRSADGIVQTSPVGSLGHPGVPFDLGLVAGAPWLVDIIYFPRETELVHAAKAKGMKATGGGGMAVFQAVRAFELFTGIPANRERMHAHFARLAFPEG